MERVCEVDCIPLNDRFWDERLEGESIEAAVVHGPLETNCYGIGVSDEVAARKQLGRVAIFVPNNLPDVITIYGIRAQTQIGYRVHAGQVFLHKNSNKFNSRNVPIQVLYIIANFHGDIFPAVPMPISMLIPLCKNPLT